MISNVQPKKIICSCNNTNNKLDIIWISQCLLDYVPICSESGRNVCSQFSKVEALVFNRRNLSTQDCSVPLQHVEIGFQSSLIRLRRRRHNLLILVGRRRRLLILVGRKQILFMGFKLNLFAGRKLNLFAGRMFLRPLLQLTLLRRSNHLDLRPTWDTTHILQQSYDGGACATDMWSEFETNVIIFTFN